MFPYRMYLFTVTSYVHSYRDITGSSESLLELFDSGRTTAYTGLSPIGSAEYVREDGSLREEREEEEEEERGIGSPEGGSEVRSQEVSGDERGFEYTTTAYIARHIRSDTGGGEITCVGGTYLNSVYSYMVIQYPHTCLYVQGV